MVDQPLHPALEAIVQALEDELDMSGDDVYSNREQLISSLPNLLGALEKAGWALVPLEPTHSMSAIGGDLTYWRSDGEGDEVQDEIGFEQARDAYIIMVRAGKVKL